MKNKPNPVAVAVILLMGVFTAMAIIFYEPLIRLWIMILGHGNDSAFVLLALCLSFLLMVVRMAARSID